MENPNYKNENIERKYLNNMLFLKVKNSQKKATINPKSKDDKCFKYVVTVA